MECPGELVRGNESVHAGSTVEISIDGIRSSFESSGGVCEVGMDTPWVLKVLVIVALMVLECRDTFDPQPSGPTSTEQRSLTLGPKCLQRRSPQTYADDQSAVYGRGSSPKHFYKDKDIDQRIPGKWIAQAKCRLDKVTLLATPKSTNRTGRLQAERAENAGQATQHHTHGCSKDGPPTLTHSSRPTTQLRARWTSL